MIGLQQIENAKPHLSKGALSGLDLYLRCAILPDAPANREEGNAGKTGMSNDVIIETQDLTKHYFDGTNVVQALNGVNIKVERGEMVAIMGPSGSGKSTLMYILGLLQPATSGVYLFNGQNILTFSAQEQAHFRNRELGFVFQSCDLLPNSTVFENLELPLIYAEADWSVRRKKIIDALERVGLGHRVDHWANRLSGGERQRAAIARALVNTPKLILGDEPTGQLDQANTEAVIEQLREVARQGFTVVLVTHEQEIGDACDRIIRLRDGKVVDDMPEELAHPDMNPTENLSPAGSA